MIRLLALPVALLALLPVEAKAFDLRETVMDRSKAIAAQISASDLCFVETGRGKARRRTPYILDFDGQCPAVDSAAHHKKSLRYDLGK
ncbi:hypothetical protein [Bradyrhizobium sp.]